MKIYYFLSRFFSPGIELLFYLYSLVTKTRRTRLVVRNESGEILLLQAWPNTNVWGLPGGGVERKERPEEAVIRELREETGLRVPSETVRYRMSLTMKGHEELIFTATASMSALPAIPPNRWEVKNAAWYPIDSLPTVSSDTKRIISEVAAKA